MVWIGLFGVFILEKVSVGNLEKGLFETAWIVVDTLVEASLGYCLDYAIQLFFLLPWLVVGENTRRPLAMSS